MQAAFVKLFGRAGTRTAWDAAVLDVLARTVEGRDDASEEDLALRPWKARWPHYVRVRDGEFLAGTLADAVSLGELMDALGAEAFWSTQRNALAGRGNVDPRQAYRQQPAVRLSHEGREWLGARLDETFGRSGRLSAEQLARLDWPNGLPAHQPSGRQSVPTRFGN